MTVYALAHVTPTDPETFKRYQEAAATALAKHGGSVAVKAPNPQLLEGSLPQPAAMVLLAFPDAEAVRAWHGDPALKEIHALRTGGADTTIYLMDPAGG
ncbi:MAG: DUF1330 domain-containing protein [Alphaproteobacteria bacterium]|nr:DUF1330 domain-containing protein [Alphaproteobacteria bacterium]